MTGRVEVGECFSSFKSIHVKRKLHLPCFTVGLLSVQSVDKKI